MDGGLSSRAGVAEVTRVVVHGATGRVGSRIAELAHHNDAFALVAAVARPGSARVGAPAASHSHKGEAVRFAADTGAVPAADVVIDFSSDAGAIRALDLARRLDASLLVGTTALAEPTLATLLDAAETRAVLVAPNTSLGVAVLSSLVREAAGALGPGFACSIVEAHHGGKKDAPSGTAKRLAEAARHAGAPVRDDQVLSIRGGDVIGEHTVRFAGPGEYVELVHRATTRDVFALGALRAAKWLHGREPGWWAMEDVLGLSRSG